MKFSLFTVGVLACILTLVAAWSKEDQEIFRLRDEVEASEGVGVTFYDFVGIKPNANQDDINKAYRKKSRTLHPDKVKQQFVADRTTGRDKPKGKKKSGVHVGKRPSDSEINAAGQAASDRFARLGIVTNILRGPGRERYDHFLANGFPKWKGTGYYYSRFRPGLGTVLIGLFIFVGGAGHYGALWLSWKRQQEFVGRYIKFARQAAWGDALNIPGVDGTSTPPVTSSSYEDENGNLQPLNRRQRRMQEKDTRKEKPDKKSKIKAARGSGAGTPTESTGPRKRVVAENGKILAVDTAGNVYLEQQDEDGITQQYLLDPNEIAKPTIRDTALVRLPRWAFDRVLSLDRSLGSLLPKKYDDVVEGDYQREEEVPGSTSSSSGADDFEVLEKTKTTAENGTDNVLRRKKSAKGR